MTIHTMEQRSEDWFAARAGRPTASSASRILTATGKPSAQAKAYLYEIVAERAGYTTPPFEPTEAMLEGIRREEESRDALAFILGAEIPEVGIVICDETGASCSPDGLCDDFGVELKNPKASTFFAELDGGKVPTTYIPQLHMSMAVTGLREWVYCCYLPGQEPIIHRVSWDEYTDAMLKSVRKFTADVEETCKRLGIEWSDDWRQK